MKMKTKLFMGFGILLVLIFALAGIGMSRLTSTDSVIKEIYENRYQKVRTSTQVRNDAAELAKGIVNLLLIDSEEIDKKNAEVVKTLSGKVMHGLQQIDEFSKEGKERELADEVLLHGKRFLDFKDQVVRLNQSGRQAEANSLRTTVGIDLQDRFTRSMGNLTNFHNEAMDAAIHQALSDNQQTVMYTGLLTLIGLLLSVAIMLWIVFGFSRGLNILSAMLANFASGKWGHAAYRVPITSNDEFGQLAGVFNRLADDLKQTTASERALNKMNEETLWLQTQIAHMYAMLEDSRKVEEMAQTFIGELARIVGAQDGALYVLKQTASGTKLVLAGTYARSESTAAAELPLGEGLVGQCAKDGKPITVEGVAGQYGAIRSAFGEMEPLTLTVLPVEYDDEVIAVFELVSLKTFSELEQKLIKQTSENLGVTLNVLMGRLRIEELLRIHQALTDELQTQSEELLSQQDELKASNEKLEEQTRALRASEEQLQRQQEELEQSNDALVRKTAELEEQVRETEEVNRQIELAKEKLEKQTLELALSSRYKSEFLANMSHELRTPLNSLLILSQQLKENKERNLTGKQVEYAETIYSSGCDLLKLIDDVLDLAKVESGRMELHEETICLQETAESMRKAFGPLARSKGLSFEVDFGGVAPGQIQTDSGRLKQILKNLLSNAFKFTNSGSVRLTIRQLAEPRAMVAFEVEDTGIGISADKQQLIFEAFRQADGTTSRKYGGTGLGLSISRQLASRLGGAIELESEEGRGSRFTLYLPHDARLASGAAEAAPAVMPPSAEAPDRWPQPSSRALANGEMPVTAFADDRGSIAEGDRVLLIIEDDAHFAAILLDMARSRGFKAVVALQGDTGLQLAKTLQPDAILLDIQLPVMDGWSVLVQLKNDASTRHIPVHVISVVDEVHQGLSMGAIAWLRKPSGKEHLEQAFTHILSFLNRDLRNLLIVEPDEEQRRSLVDLIAHDDVRITAVAGGGEALKVLAAQPFDCMVLDYGMTGPSVYELLDRIKADEGLRRLPIVIYTGKTLDKKEQLRLKKYAESIIIKDVKSPERLLDETSLFLHRVEENLPEEKQQVLQKLHSIETVFKGKKVLLVDDDIRNVFALSNLLEGLGMQVAFAETGRQALDSLDREPDFDLVLMDIMMPEMDGYEAMRAIRGDERLDRLPIIALTAKAMKDDREKCIQAGASDYITKPVHTEQLLSLMRVWLYK
ncbi:response regulator [Paenibacillus tyrfis]|uniref:Circadian input-output histidine kinase CikA n=1 Tax=Paenibacillus tyrfis TaxID=1501230 RepID=A0A081NZD0_9BACL|nr:response regulator [Paenibacillus tyrfis]KEQ23803.1 histidine kinase [Paenibacillus tyrfis]